MVHMDHVPKSPRDTGSSCDWESGFVAEIKVSGYEDWEVSV